MLDIAVWNSEESVDWGYNFESTSPMLKLKDWVLMRCFKEKNLK